MDTDILSITSTKMVMMTSHPRDKWSSKQDDRHIQEETKRLLEIPYSIILSNCHMNSWYWYLHKQKRRKFYKPTSFNPFVSILFIQQIHDILPTIFSTKHPKTINSPISLIASQPWAYPHFQLKYPYPPKIVKASRLVIERR